MPDFVVVFYNHNFDVCFNICLLMYACMLLPQASLSSFAGKFEFEMEVCLRKNLYVCNQASNSLEIWTI